MTANMIHVENFLCFIKLRGGTLFSLYFTMIFGFFALSLMFTASRSTNGLILADSLELIIFAVIMMGILVAVWALIFFPEMNKKYEENSINAICIKYFSIFSGFLAVLGFFIWVTSTVVLRQDVNTFMLFAFTAISWIGVFAHFAAVAYSFYLSIIQSDNDYREGSLITNNIYDEVLERNLNSCLVKMNDDIPQLLSSSSSANGNGNHYVELKQN